MRSTFLSSPMALAALLLLAALSGTAAAQTFCRATLGLAFCEFCASATTCQQCFSSYSLAAGNTQCIECNFQGLCLRCQTANRCAQCKANFTAINGGISCVPCNTPNCLACSGQNYCVSCAASYTVFEGECNQCNITNCVQCNSPNICSTCTIFYNPDPVTGTSCTLCNVAECATCATENYCTQCKGIYAPSETGTCVACNITQCAVCEFSNICKQCNPGFTLATNFIQCFSCNIENCVSCNAAADICNQCEEGYSLNLAGGTSCDPCNVPNCESCNSANECGNCDPGFFVDGTKACTSCGVNNCDFCAAVGTCQSCVPGFGLVNGQCQACRVNNCGTCDSDINTCTVCLSNFTLNAAGLCLFCGIQYCTACSSSGVCFRCSNVTSFYLTSNGSACLFCDTNCAVCSANKFCQTCLNPAFLPSLIGQCVLCTVPNCQSCSVPNNCVLCIEGATFSVSSPGSCVLCNVSNCSNCSTNNVCSICFQGYVVNSNGTCSLSCNTSLCALCVQPDYCGQCEGNTTTMNITLFKGQCFACQDPNCIGCTGNNTCGACINASYRISPSGICAICSDINCASCDENNATNCSACVNTFYNLTNGQCIPSQPCNIQNCTTCGFAIDTNTTVCVNCVPGMSPFQQSCVLCNVTNCLQCNTQDFCAVCSTGFSVISDGSCTTCNVTNCSACSTLNVCSNCSAGFSLISNNNTCVPCNISGCIVCTLANVCSSCQEGFNLNVSSNTCTFSCVDPNCLASSCTVDASNCTQCQDGYLAVNGSCITCNVSNCAQCTQNNVCNICTQNYSPINGTCILCTLQFCASCSAENVCTDCQLNYQLVNSTCSPYSCAVANCQACSLNDICAVCFEQFSLFNKTCISCNVANCLTCQTANVCSQCLPSFHYISASNTCLAPSAPQCPSGCVQGSCTVTPGGLSNCSSCQTGYALFQMNTYFASADPRDPYMNLKLGICMPCPANCFSCVEAVMGYKGPPIVASNCTNCSVGFIASWVTGQCLPCPANCDICTCIQNTCVPFCSNCTTGYIQNGTGGCMLAPNYPCPNCRTNACTITNSGFGTCSACERGTLAMLKTFFNGSSANGETLGICEQCPIACLSCYYETIYPTNNSGQGVYAINCIQCAITFTWNSNTGQCIPCSDNCVTCGYSASGNYTYCQTCQPGYSLNYTAGYPYPCGFNGSATTNTSNSTTPNITNLTYECPFCNPGSCQFTSAGLGNCSSCTQGALTYMQAFLNTNRSSFQIVGVCQLCPQNCSNCSYGTISSSSGQSYGITCTACNSGFAVNSTDGQCMPCSANCVVCQVSGPYNFCLNCSTGYTVNYGTWPLTCIVQSTSTQEQPTGSDPASDTIASLAVWGSFMILALGVLAFFMYKRYYAVKAEAQKPLIELPETINSPYS